MFTTEGHIVSVDERFRSSLWEDILPAEGDSSHKAKATVLKAANFSSNVRNAGLLLWGWGRGSRTHSPWEVCCRCLL